MTDAARTRLLPRMSTLFVVALCAGIALPLAAQDKMGMGKMDAAGMEKMMSDWPQASKDAAMFMANKYGPPAAMTSDMIIWGKAGPWKRTVVYKMEYVHEFPGHHTDVMQQWIDYRVAPNRLNELAMYDGSVVFERTSGELSARCDKEAANFLALNLADDIVNRRQTVDGARKMYGEQIMAMKAMKSAPYTEKLRFTVQMGGTNDPDHPGPSKMKRK